MATVGSGIKYSNSNENYKNNYDKSGNQPLVIVGFTFAFWSFLTLTNGTAAQAAAVYSNIDFLSNPSFEPICAPQQERFMESNGKESSLILKFNSYDATEKTKSCKRILSAPSSYGFIVRLILPKIRPHNHHHHHQQSSVKDAQKDSSTDSVMEAHRSKAATSKNKITALNEMTSLIDKLNSSVQLKTSSLGRTCPLSIFSSLDPHTPQWRVDPCQLEDTAPEMEDPVRLFHGRLRIVWVHGHQELDSKLMVTVLGKGDQCRSEKKHHCLKIGDEPILCISKDLVCDGIRHCPNSNEYDSDEDYAMCWKRRRFDEPMPAMESDIFEHFALEVFRNLFAFDVPSWPGVATTTAITTTPSTSSSSSAEAKKTTSSSSSASSTASSGDESNRDNSDGDDDEDDEQLTAHSNATEMATNGTNSNNTEAGGHRRGSTRQGLNSDLSKYGPWGYLMLGMLLCGGALLICGLWASATQHAAQNERESNLQPGSNAGNSSTNDHQTSSGAPPNYEELDPPPSYSTLFPNQKAASSTTLSSLSIATATVASAPARVQLEPQASGSGSVVATHASP